MFPFKMALLLLTVNVASLLRAEVPVANPSATYQERLLWTPEQRKAAERSDGQAFKLKMEEERLRKGISDHQKAEDRMRTPSRNGSYGIGGKSEPTTWENVIACLFWMMVCVAGMGLAKGIGRLCQSGRVPKLDHWTEPFAELAWIFARVFLFTVVLGLIFLLFGW